MFSIALLLAAGVVVVVLTVVAGGTRVSARDIAWIGGTATSSADEAEVYRRYLQRHRRHRLAGGLFGTLLAITVGIRLYGSVTIGMGSQSPLADVLFCALAGVLVGAFSAESFRLSEPPSSTVSASLAEHPGAARPDLVRAARCISLVSLAVGGLVAATGHGFSPLWVAIVGLSATLVAEATQAAISGRRRPLLSDRAQVVDLRMRSFASTSTAGLQLAAAVLAATWTLSKVPGTDSGAGVAVLSLAVIGGLVATVVLLRRASPRPPRKWIARPS